MKTRKRMIKAFNRRVFRTAFLAALSGASLGCVNAQAIAPESMPQRGLVPAGSYSFSEIETINNVNGNVFYRFPLASLPRGRAGFSMGVNLTYNSQIYDIGFEPRNSEVSPGTPTIFQNLQASQWGGWQYGFIYSLDLEQRATLGYGSSCYGTPDNWKIYKLSLITPDGSHHTLHLYPNTPSNPSGYAYWDNNGDGFYDVDPSGQGYLCPQQTKPPVGDLTYYTSDGSYLKVVVSQYGGPSWTNHQWTVNFPDGRTAIGYGAQMIAAYDRNGNGVMINNNYSQSYPYPIVQTVLTDAQARAVAITYNPNITYSTQDTITQTGYGQQTLTWTVNWTNVSLYGSTLQYTCSPYNDQCNANMSQRAVSSITFPVAQDNSALQYNFGYDDNSVPGWGELNDFTVNKVIGNVVYPVGLHVHYNYSEENQFKSVYITENPVSQKTLTWTDEADSSQRVETSSFNFYNTSSQITNPDGVTVHNYFYDPHILSNPKRGLVYKAAQPDGSTIERVWQHNRPYGGQGIDPANPYVKNEFRSVASAGAPLKAAVKVISYDKNGNQTLQEEYENQDHDWIPYNSIYHIGDIPYGFSGGALVRTTSNNAKYGTATAGDGNETIVDYSNAYWHPGSPAAWGLIASSFTTGIGPGSSSSFSYGDQYGHPNLMNESRSDSASPTGTPITTHYTYDQYGNQLSIQNGRGNTTSLTYDTNGLCVTHKVISNARTFAYTCDPDRGLVKTETDSDHGITRSYDYDRFGRTTLVSESGGGLTRRTQTAYNDSSRQIVVTSDLDVGSQTTQTTWYDPLGRIRQTRDAAGNTVQTRYYTPPNGGFSYQATSNPYGTLNDLTMGWTRTMFDPNGRAAQVQTFSGPTLPCPWDNNPTPCPLATYANSTGKVTASYDAETTTMVDQQNISRTTKVDALGRLNQITESGIGATTTYGYDALDGLVSVTQPGVQQRTFTYSSLKRLISAYNPETGTTNYTYDNNGNVSARTRGGVTPGSTITTTYTYDELDQLTQKSYSDYASSPPTPWQTYTYDHGWLNSVSGGGISYQYTGFDGLGRVTNSSQTTSGVTYPFTYTYNLAGSAKTMTLPSGRVMTTSYDSAGRPASVQGKLGTITATYVSSASYGPHSALQQINLGNGLMESTTYNPRLQPTQIQVGSLLTLSYAYSQTNNNGNIFNQTIARPGVGAWTQTYGYDMANRLTSASETGSGSWSEGFGYDNRGNRWVVIPSTNGLPPLTLETPQSLLAQSSDWFVSTDNHIAPNFGWVYDGAGNVKSVGGMSRTFSYDAESRQISATVNGKTTTYSYDGDGRRVMKSVGGQATVYVYDASGQLAAEYGPASSGPGPNYLTADHLGSTRLVTNSSGAVQKCYDYLPFGEEIGNGTAGRSGCYGSSSYPTNTPDLVSEKFTGKERDAESGLDFFESRYMSSAQGRFTSPDDPLAGIYPSNPQSWNRYAYALNNPFLFIDPDGHEPCENGINPENGNICTVSVAKSPITTNEKVSANAKSFVNTFVDLLNMTPAGLFYSYLAGKPGVDRMQPSTFGEARQMRTNSASADLLVVGELVIPQKATLLAAATATDTGQLTRAGRALQKHGSRPGSLFPGPAGGPAQLNEMGLRIVESVLTDPGRMTQIRHHARFGEILEIKSSGGQGVRFSSDGKQFIGFIE